MKENIILTIIWSQWGVLGMYVTDCAWRYSSHHKLQKMINIRKAFKLLWLRIQRKDWLNYDFERNIA
jgi:hypothetical protein